MIRKANVFISNNYKNDFIAIKKAAVELGIQSPTIIAVEMGKEMPILTTLTNIGSHNRLNQSSNYNDVISCLLEKGIFISDDDLFKRVYGLAKTETARGALKNGRIEIIKPGLISRHKCKLTNKEELIYINKDKSFEYILK